MKPKLYVIELSLCFSGPTANTESFMTPCDVEKLFVVGYREYLSSEQSPMDGHVWFYILAWVWIPYEETV